MVIIALSYTFDGTKIGIKFKKPSPSEEIILVKKLVDALFLFCRTLNN